MAHNEHQTSMNPLAARLYRMLYCAAAIALVSTTARYPQSAAINRARSFSMIKQPVVASRCQSRVCRATTKYCKARSTHVASTRIESVSTNISSVVIPSNILSVVHQSTNAWYQNSLTRTHTEPDSKATVYVFGVCNYSPLQRNVIKQLVESLRPDVLALEQPLSTSSTAVLPYPRFIDVLLAAGDSLPSTGLGTRIDTPAAQQHGSNEQALQQLLEELTACSTSAKVGRDIFDPFEAFGYYAGLDYVTKAEQIAIALQLFGFAPGQECADAVQLGQELGFQVHCIDAPLKLQEAWVQRMLRQFALNESDLGRQLQLELEATQKLVPKNYADWDLSLSQQVSELDEAQAMVAFKVSRAVAAAMLDVATTQATLTAQARLQPLKFSHFDMRALYMARQIRELCHRQVMSAQRVGRIEDIKAPEGKTCVVAVVGRQYVDTIHRLWDDKTSELWRGDVPRTFAPSSLEQLPSGEVDPDVEHGGSRPVGYKPIDLGSMLSQQKQQS